MSAVVAILHTTFRLQVWVFRFMVLIATFNNISYIVVVSFIGGEIHRPIARHRQTLSHSVVSSSPDLSRIQTKLVVIGTDSIGSCKSNYRTITTTTVNGYR